LGAKKEGVTNIKKDFQKAPNGKVKTVKNVARRGERQKNSKRIERRHTSRKERSVRENYTCLPCQRERGPVKQRQGFFVSFRGGENPVRET